MSITPQKSIFSALTLGTSLAIILLFLESLYRGQPFDFYRPELIAFNAKADLNGAGGKRTVLLLGDSFTAGNGSYVKTLKRKLPDLRMINSGIPGSGIIEASLIANGRITRFEPSILIYQMYVGNDLFDISYPTNWRTLSLARNIYWAVCNHLRLIAFLNYRLGQIRGAYLARGSEPDQASNLDDGREEFSPDRFINNEAIFLKADPHLIEKQIRVMEERRQDFSYLMIKLHAVLSTKDESCPCYLLVIPHASQISPRYLERTKRLGGLFRYEAEIFKTDYPFVNLLQAEFKNCVLLNPLGLFQQKEESGVRIYRTNDIHLSPQGNTILAEYVGEALASR